MKDLEYLFKYSFMRYDLRPEDILEIPNTIRYNCEVNGNKPLKNGKIRNGIDYLIFSHEYNGEIQNNAIPNSVKTVVFGCNYDRYVDENTFPRQLESLYFGESFNKPLYEGIFPNTLKDIRFGESFNRPIHGFLPINLEKIELGNDFTQNIQIGTFPYTLLELTIHSKLSIHWTQGIIPENVTKIWFEQCDEMTFDNGSFPSSLTELRLKGHNMTDFDISVLTGKNINFELLSLEYIDVINGELMGEIPINELILNCIRGLNRIPDGIRKMKICCSHINVGNGFIPESVEDLELLMFNESPAILPRTLKKLVINKYSKYNGTVGINDLPPYLEELIIGKTTHLIDFKCIPRYIKEIYCHEETFVIPKIEIPFLLNYFEKRDKTSNLYHILIGPVLFKVSFEKHSKINSHMNKFKKYINQNQLDRLRPFKNELKAKLNNINNIQNYINLGYSIEDTLSFVGF